MLRLFDKDVNPTMNKIFDWIVGLCVIMVAAALAFQIVDTRLPLRITERTVLTPEVEAGGELRIRIKYIADKQCASITDRFIFDGRGDRILLEPNVSEAGTSVVGLDEEFNEAVSIPIDATPGDATYRTITTYRCNFWQKYISALVGPVRELHFKILPRKTTELSEDGTVTLNLGEINIIDLTKITVDKPK